jgi:hypothetical protein
MSQQQNYAVPDPNNPGQMMSRYPVDAQRATPGSSAHAYIDYIEGALADSLERIGAVELRLRTLEAAHADLTSAFHRRITEFEARLDHASSEIKELSEFQKPIP